MNTHKLPKGCTDVAQFLLNGDRVADPEHPSTRFYPLEEYQDQLAAHRIDVAIDYPIVDRYFDIVISQPKDHTWLVALLGFVYGICREGRAPSDDFAFWWQALPVLRAVGHEADVRRKMFELFFLKHGYYFSGTAPTRICVRGEKYHFDQVDNQLVENLSCFVAEYR